ncbi:MAG: TIGR01459 family HAD-type hydrolase, partial [Gammaproteobacteria bacterium]
PSSVIYSKLKSFGINIDGAKMITSGDVVRHQIQTKEKDEVFSKLGSKLYHLGANRNQDILNGIKAEEVKTVADADYVLCSAYFDEGENLLQHDLIFKEMLVLKKPMVCSNPDKVVIHGSKNRYCSGFLAERYRQMGGEVFVYGKPQKNIFDFLFNQITVKDQSKVLMIGDTLETDILGAKQAGIDSLLVLTGNMERIIGKRNQAEKEPCFDDLLKSSDLKPNWFVDRLTFFPFVASRLKGSPP